MNDCNWMIETALFLETMVMNGEFSIGPETIHFVNGVACALRAVANMAED